MTIIDRGSGIPIVLVPGIQGRWEWMGPTVDALSKRCRVITFSLADEPTSGSNIDGASGLESYVQQVEQALDTTGVGRAIVCGVSYGGLIAALFAARRPSRVDGVVLISAIPPSWRADARTRFLMRAPTLLSPLFCINSLRLLTEMAAAKGGWLAGLAFGLRHVWTVTLHRFSPRLMARRAALLDATDLEREVAAVRAPALVITGEAGLDQVVPVRLTMDYLRLWPQATATTLARTGHLGSITKPDEFADLVLRFAEQVSRHEDQRRRIV